MNPPRFPRVAVGLLALLLAQAALAADDKVPGEVLVHQEPEFTSPGLSAGEEITFRKEFAVSAEIWQRQQRLGHSGAKPPLSAEQAIELARADISEASPKDRTLVRLESLQHRPTPSRDGPGVPYFLVEFAVNGSEIHRVVLMDGTVVKSRLRKVAKK